MVHLDRIYTRGGDQGETSLGNGRRVSKLDPRIEAGGSVDELNCCLGVATAAAGGEPIQSVLMALQQFLFDLGADLCVPLPEDGEKDLLPGRINDQHVRQLESLIDRFNDRLSPLTSFILPGGNPAAAGLHLARAICRRAERDMLRLQQVERLNPSLLIALNRLSDLLFVLARTANDEGRADVLWQGGRGLQLE
jgi:cob(I)alamin adenosyltransferase